MSNSSRHRHAICGNFSNLEKYPQPTSNSSRHQHAICGNFSKLEKYPELLWHRHATQQVCQSMVLTARTLFGHPMPQYLNALTIATNQAIADTGATSIFIMEGADVDNKRPAMSPLTINLPYGKQIRSTHVCNIQIPGLPTMLLGHIVPSLSIASLIGNRPLCQAGCKVIFDDKKCNVVFNGVVILRGYKDLSTDLWTLPIPTTKVCTAPEPRVLSQPGPCNGRAPHLPMDTRDPGTTLATFTHSVKT
jgi:hypothetical protein